jgi:prepilin signal peptidase PulO-like enzyme (type II secretory pathway)
LLIVVLMPVVVLPWEHRKVPDALYIAIAACGLASSALHQGFSGLAWSAGSAIACLVVVGAAVTGLRAATRLRILTGGQIKLLAAGATWLGPAGTIIMILVAAFVLFAAAALLQVSQRQRRPDSAAVVAMTIVIVAFQQQLLGL